MEPERLVPEAFATRFTNRTLGEAILGCFLLDVDADGFLVAIRRDGKGATHIPLDQVESVEDHGEAMTLTDTYPRARKVIIYFSIDKAPPLLVQILQREYSYTKLNEIQAARRTSNPGNACGCAAKGSSVQSRTSCVKDCDDCWSGTCSSSNWCKVHSLGTYCNECPFE